MISVRCETSQSVLSSGEIPIAMARADSGNSDSTKRKIRLVKHPGYQWTARDLRVEVTAQGKSREEALDSLDTVIEAVEGDDGRSPTDEEIRNLGVDPDTARSQSDELPGFLK